MEFVNEGADLVPFAYVRSELDGEPKIDAGTSERGGAGSAARSDSPRRFGISRVARCPSKLRRRPQSPAARRQRAKSAPTSRRPQRPYPSMAGCWRLQRLGSASMTCPRRFVVEPADGVRATPGRARRRGIEDAWRARGGARYRANARNRRPSHGHTRISGVRISVHERSRNSRAQSVC